MKRVIWAMIFFSTLVYGQTQNLSKHSLTAGNCSSCHSCDVPTKQNPCLNPCPREKMVTVRQSPEDAPEIIKIDVLANKYQPAAFSHKIHAQMSEMSGGCEGCHHYNTSGPILSCSSCHSVERKRTDLSKPDLQAAYHRQCISCHKEWSGSSDCNSCHLPKGAKLSSSKDLTGKDHPEVLEPKKIVYETNYQKGKLVTFFHNEHTDLFGFDCVSCHKQENCSTCHGVSKTRSVQLASAKTPIKVSRSKEENHKQCFSCHQDDECSSCHMDKEMGPFNHKISTGWALNKFHDKLDCTKCHGSKGTFSKLNNNCVSCHKDFIAGKFNHAKTGLKLDELHADLDCSDCHTDNNFSKTDCSSCHDDLSFPKDKPGSLVKISRIN
jgi:hypothetical protein